MTTSRGPAAPEPGPAAPGNRNLVAAALIAVPVLLLATGLWLLAGALERSASARASVAPLERWLAPRADTVLERIAFGSCLDQKRPQPVWKAVLATKPQLFLMMGDNVYGDVKGPDLAELREAYKVQAAQTDLAALRQSVPVLATWDDHDYGRNDASAAFPWKSGARKLFAEFWQLRDGELPPDGVWRARIVGQPGRRVQIIMLDLRSHRSAFDEIPLAERTSSAARYRAAGPEARKTMLGDAQWAWLAGELKKPAEVRLIVSSIQLLAEGHRFERWGHMPAERDRFFALMRETGARGILVLSGDRHRAQIYKRTADVPYTLHEVTSSALNRSFAGADPEDPGRLGPMIGDDNFGLLTIDWAGKRLRATINRARDGSAAATLDLTFKDIGVP